MKGVNEYVERILSYISELDPDIEVVKINILEDHVHNEVLQVFKVEGLENGWFQEDI